MTVLRWNDQQRLAAAHELKNPLASLLALAESLSFLEGEEHTAKRTTHIQKMKAKIHLLNQRVSDIFDALRLSNEGLHFHDQVVPLGDLLAQVVRQAQLAHPQASFQLQAPVEVTLKTDPYRLTQALEHLLNNAATFSPGGKPIRISAIKSNGSVQIVIQDEGQGIPPEEQEKIFALYYQIPRPQPAGGLGIGLALVQEIVQHYGGNIRVESQVGQGSCFTMTLPITREKP